MPYPSDGMCPRCVRMEQTSSPTPEAASGHSGVPKEPSRVVHLVRSLDQGGLERVVLDLAKTIDTRLFEPHVACLGEPGALAGLFEAHSVPVHSLRASNRVSALLRLIRLLDRLDAHIVHTHNPVPHAVGAVARGLGRRRALVHTKHGRNYPGVRRAVISNRLASAVTDVVVAVSDDAAQVATEVERTPADKVRVIRNGVDLALWRPVCREGRLPRRAVHVARLDPVKDQHTLLRATRQIVDRLPDFRLDIVGDGPARAVLERQSCSLRLEGNVIFHGFRDDVPRLLADADLFMLSSRSEGLALTLVEAMATGLPVVATDVGGNREIVMDGVTGLLVPPSSAEILAEAALRLLLDPSRLRSLGFSARKRVEDHFDLRVVVRRYQETYLEALRRVAQDRGVSGRPC